MGPRLFSRGKSRRPVGPSWRRRASMGPRLFSRGKNALRHVAECVQALQWGRDFSAAERALVWKYGGGK